MYYNQSFCKQNRENLKSIINIILYCNRQLYEKVISQGAEAQLRLINNIVEKYRLTKSYRHPLIDKQIRKRRTRSEYKIHKYLEDKGIPVPKLITQTQQEAENSFIIKMQYIEGKTLTQIYYDDQQLFKQLLLQAGYIIRQLHDANTNDNDLTTSNFIYEYKTQKLYLIDFGLSTLNTTYETKAIDIFMMEKSILALTGQEELVKQILIGYKQNKEIDQELQRKLEEVRLRGRKR